MLVEHARRRGAIMWAMPNELAPARMPRAPILTCNRCGDNLGHIDTARKLQLSIGTRLGAARMHARRPQLIELLQSLRALLLANHVPSQQSQQLGQRHVLLHTAL